MILKQLSIHQLRIFDEYKVQFHPQFTLISGNNGKGKTTILEALYLLSSGRSFRSKDREHLIRDGNRECNLFAKCTDDQSIALQKSLDKPTIAKINSQTCTLTSELAAFLPCQLFYQDMFEIINAGSAIRRALLDWGLFHTEPQYHALFKDYAKALKQRNALLKQRAPRAHFEPWDALMSSLSDSLDALRRQYFQQLSEVFEQVIKQLSSIDCSLHYYKGWDRKSEGKTLNAILKQSFESDCNRQYTHYGPHHADIEIATDTNKAKHYLSRGQQKMILIGLKLAQAQMLAKPCLFLMDDIGSELDAPHLQALINYLAATKGQYVITAKPKELDSYLAHFDYQELVLS